MSITKTESVSNNILSIKKSKSSDHRKITKPIMERRRRARINNSLDQIKCLILDACDKDPSRYTKLEKADILEMTVGYLQNIRKSQILKEPSTFVTFKKGFKECATAVTGFVEKAEGVDIKVKSRLINYLSNCTQSLTPTSFAKSFSSHAPNSTNICSSNNFQSVLIENFLNGIKKSSSSGSVQTPIDVNNNPIPNIPSSPSTPIPKSHQYPFKFYKSLQTHNQKTSSHSPSYEMPSIPTSKLLSDAYLLSLYFQPNNVCMWRPW